MDKIKPKYQGINNDNCIETTLYFMGHWDIQRQLYRFIDGTCGGEHLSVELKPGHLITIDDIHIDQGMHRVEMRIIKDGDEFRYNARMHEEALRLFGSFGDHEVNVDERRPCLSFEEIQAIQSIPSRTLRDIVLCTITRPLPTYEISKKN